MNKLPYQHLSFPLNVYAYSLYLQQGRVDYLHYGLVEPHEDAWEIGALMAQQRSTDLLLARLPPPPCRILEIGLGLGTLSALLTELGYQVTSISPDPHQIAIAETRSGHHNFKLQCISFEEFNTLAESFDVILLQESAQYIDSLILFNKAYHFLRPQGCLLLVDEVGLKRTAADTIEGLPLLKHSLAQAERCGFKMIEHLDLSKKAAPTLDYLLRAIETHRQRLLTDLALPEENLAALVDSLRLYRQKYQDGRYGYVLLQLQRGQKPRWKITEVTAQHQEAMRTLFADVFQHPMSRALWHWKYAQGQGLATAAWKGSQMVAHYGGLIRELSYFGVPKTGVQIVDVMVFGQERGLLTRRGPYFLVGATFPECYAGYGKRILLGFGFPTQRAIRTAELLGLYADVGKMVEMRWSAMLSWPQLSSRIRHLNPQTVADDCQLIEHMWNKMRPCLTEAIAGVRDWAYVRHRYLEHPHKKYELLLVSRRFSGQPLGIIVLYRDDTVCKLLDIIAPLNQIPLLIRQARCIAGHWGVKTLSLWITENFAPLFLRASGEPYPLDIRIPHCIWYEGPPVEEVRNKWWLMGGDTDFL